MKHIHELKTPETTDEQFQGFLARTTHPKRTMTLAEAARYAPGAYFPLTIDRGRSFTPAASSSTTSAMRAARRSGRRVVASIQRR
jgi:hypothetical protein